MTHNPLPNRNANRELDIHQLARLHDLARAHAEQLRREAIIAFWDKLFAALQFGFLRSTEKNRANSALTATARNSKCEPMDC